MHKRLYITIRQKMIAKGFYQKELAQAVGISEGMLGRYLRGERAFDMLTAERIARVLDIATEEFYTSFQAQGACRQGARELSA